MRCWKASRNAAFNEAVVQSLLNWRGDARRLKEQQKQATKVVVYEGAYIYSVAAQARLTQAIKPVTDTLDRIDYLFSVLGRK